MQHFDAFDEDKARDECGIFGIFGHPKAAELTYLGLRALQHRGQESSGIVTSDNYSFSSYRNMGLVENVFDAETLAKLTGHIAVGHNRYSTAGASHLGNTQPLTCEYKHGPPRNCTQWQPCKRTEDTQRTGKPRGNLQFNFRYGSNCSPHCPL